MLTAEAFVRSGKVRDLFDLPDDRLLLIASDRISAFDVVLPTEIPDKGRVLTGLSRFWFDETESIVPNHLLEVDVAIVKDAWEAAIGESDVQPTRPLEVADFASWRGRVMVCRARRGHPDRGGRPRLPGRLRLEGVPGHGSCRRDPAAAGPARERAPARADLHAGDEGARPASTTRTSTSTAWSVTSGSTWCPTRPPPGRWPRPSATDRWSCIATPRPSRRGSGILIADTKFEFGLTGLDEPVAEAPARRLVESLTLIDEVLTPDSSRFWDVKTYQPGRPQASFDKQYVRDWLERQPWDKTAPGPALPDDVVRGTRERYVAAYERITGASFDRYLAEDVIAR